MRHSIKISVLALVSVLGSTVFAEPIAYWQMQDKSTGPLIAGSKITSLQNSPALDAVVSNNKTIKINFSEDVPGKVIISGNTVVNPRNKASLKIIGSGRKFNVLTVAGNKLLDLDEFTFEAFVKIKKFPQWGRLFYKQRNKDRFSWILSLKNKTGLLRARIDSNPENAKQLTGFNQGLGTKFKTDDGKWHHIAVTYDRLTQEFKIFADYQLQAKCKTALPIIYDEKQPLVILGAYSGYLNAWVDEIRFSDTALQPDNFLKIKQ